MFDDIVTRDHLFADAVETNRCYNSLLGYQSYLGQVNTTHSGRQCQRWDVDYPQKDRGSSASNPNMFPEGDLALAANYCRCPSLDYVEAFWCYTIDPKVRWESCNIWRCFGNNSTPCYVKNVKTTKKQYEIIPINMLSMCPS